MKNGNQMELILLRHGETAWNKEKRTQGQLDIPLSPAGRKQAELAGRHLFQQTGGKLKAVYTSDLKRAAETASIIAGMFGLEPRFDRRLREIKLGPWEGLTWREINSLYPRESRIWLEEPTRLRLSGAETLEEVVERVDDAIKEIIRACQAERVLVVSHGLAIKGLLCSLQGKPLDKWRDISQGNTAINHIFFSKDNCCLQALDFRGHLDRA